MIKNQVMYNTAINGFVQADLLAKLITLKQAEINFSRPLLELENLVLGDDLTKLNLTKIKKILTELQKTHGKEREMLGEIIATLEVLTQGDTLE